LRHRNTTTHALRGLIAVILLTILVVAGGSETLAQTKAAREICLTFDELPAARTFGEIDREAINYLILDALKRHEIKAAGFVVGDQIEDSFDILGRWLNAGHRLGNLTWSGQDFNLLGPEQFITDIRKGADALEPMLKGFGQKKRYFRFPFMHYGDNVERRRAATLFLDDQGHTICPASVIPEDYLYNLQLTKLGKTPDSAKFEQLLNDYINHVLDELERVERLANDIVGRSIRHILLLRTNRLNAVYLDEMIMALKDDGYKFVTLDAALKDKVYQKEEAYYGLKGLGYLDMIQQSDPDLLPAE
jgi:peptidoglycan/xylan/chitin deacetylase (PgdA/CDA1 family)